MYRKQIGPNWQTLLNSCSKYFYITKMTRFKIYSKLRENSLSVILNYIFSLVIFGQSSLSYLSFIAKFIDRSKNIYYFMRTQNRISALWLQNMWRISFDIDINMNKLNKKMIVFIYYIHYTFIHSYFMSTILLCSKVNFLC